MSKEQKRFKYFRFSDGIYREDAAPYHLIDRNVASMGRVAARIDEADGFPDGITRWIAKDPGGRTFLSWTEEEMEERLASVKQSNSLENLCDNLVIIEKDSPNLPRLTHRCFGVFTLTECERKGLQENELEIYGSIWVKGDLIKVAKMNEKGELELL